MTIDEYFDRIENPDHREILRSVIDWIQQEFPTLVIEIKWNQPMFLDHGTFIIAFSHAKNHYSVGPEKLIIDRFRNEIEKHYTAKKMLFQVKWNQPMDYHLLRVLIAATMEEKKDYDNFWLS